MADLERTQIYLTRAELSVLDRMKGETGVSQSELVRRAIDRAYLRHEARTHEEEIAIIRRAAGAWADRTETGVEYVDRLRSGRLLRTLFGGRTPKRARQSKRQGKASKLVRK